MVRAEHKGTKEIGQIGLVVAGTEAETTLDSVEAIETGRASGLKT